jgi:hypothetical protein
VELLVAEGENELAGLVARWALDGKEFLQAMGEQWPDAGPFARTHPGVFGYQN